MQQVKKSPDVDTDLPVSRQNEAHIYNHYGWDPYWGGGYYPMGNGMSPPFGAPLYRSGSRPRDPDNGDTHQNEGDSHLRSIAAVTGYHIHAADGEIGHVEDFLVDDAGWDVRYITVDTRNWWPGKRVLISPRSVREIDWADSLIQLNVSRQKVKDGPTLESAMTVDRAYEEKHRAYYGYGLRGTLT